MLMAAVVVVEIEVALEVGTLVESTPQVAEAEEEIEIVMMVEEKMDLEGGSVVVVRSELENLWRVGKYLVVVIRWT